EKEGQKTLPGHKGGAGISHRDGEGNMTSLRGKVAWVTGAGSGIGEAAALALAGAGATVVLTGRRKEPLEAVAKRIEAGTGRAHVEAGDVTDAKRVNAIANAVRSMLGRLDILLNTPAVTLRHPPP